MVNFFGLGMGIRFRENSPPIPLSEWSAKSLSKDFPWFPRLKLQKEIRMGRMAKLRWKKEIEGKSYPTLLIPNWTFNQKKFGNWKPDKELPDFALETPEGITPFYLKRVTMDLQKPNVVAKEWNCELIFLGEIKRFLLTKRAKKNHLGNVIINWSLSVDLELQIKNVINDSLIYEERVSETFEKKESERNHLMAIKEVPLLYNHPRMEQTVLKDFFEFFEKKIASFASSSLLPSSKK